jgi:hypothetical protein
MTITFRTGGNIFTREEFGGISGLVAKYREDGELLVLNRGENARGYAICLRFGYADSERPGKKRKGEVELPHGFAEHPPLRDPKPYHRCKGKAIDRPLLMMRNKILAARQVTDVLLLEFGGCLGTAASDAALVQTLGFALQRGGCSLLELDPREIGVLTPIPVGPNGMEHGVVLYDNVPGGAGHVRELLDLGDRLLNEAEKVLFVDDTHHKLCESACLQCLLSFDSQIAAATMPFVRRTALSLLRRLLEGMTQS